MLIPSNSPPRGRPRPCSSRIAAPLQLQHAPALQHRRATRSHDRTPAACPAKGKRPSTLLAPAPSRAHVQIISCCLRSFHLHDSREMRGAGDLAFHKIDKFSACATLLPHILAQPPWSLPLPRSAFALRFRVPHPLLPWHGDSRSRTSSRAEREALIGWGLGGTHPGVHAHALVCSQRVQKLSVSHLARRKLREIRAAIPPHLFVRDTRRGLMWLALDFLMAAACWKAALYIDPTFRSRAMVQLLSPAGAQAARWTCWLI